MKVDTVLVLHREKHRQFSPCCVYQIRIHTLQPVVVTQKHPITWCPGQQWPWACSDVRMNLFMAAGQNRNNDHMHRCRCGIILGVQAF